MVWSAATVAEEALRSIGMYSPYDDAPDPEHFSIALRRLDSLIAFLVAVDEIKFFRTVEQEITLTANQREYDLNGLLGTDLQYIRSIFRTYNGGERTEVDIVREIVYNKKRAETSESSIPDYVYIERKKNPKMYVHGTPAVSGYKFLVTGCRFPNSMLVDNGATATEFSEAWNLCLTELLAANIGNGPITQLPEQELRRKEGSGERMKRQLLAYNQASNQNIEFGATQVNSFLGFEMTTYRRTTLPLFQIANAAYKNAVVTFYKVDVSDYSQTTELATIYDSASSGSTLSNPYTLSSTGRSNNIMYFDHPLVAVIGETDIGAHTTGIIFPRTGDYVGEWDSETSYLAGQIIKDGSNSSNTGNLYIAASDHTSSVFATDVSDGKLVLILDTEIASTSSTAAAASATAAEGYKDDAETAASSATASASSASGSASSASTSADAAATSAASLADFRHFTSTGSSNAYVGDLTPDATLTDGAVFRFEANHTNTGSATLNIDGTGAKTIKKFYNSNLSSGDIKQGGFYWVAYDAANDTYQLLTLLGQATTAGLNDLSDVSAGTPSTNDGLFYTGAAWENRTAAQSRTHLGLGSLATKNTVDVSDLSTGTDGELITWDSGGNPDTVAAGSAGDILTSQGAGSVPVFQAPYTVTAGTALTGGGQLTSNITLNVDTGTGANKVPVMDGSGVLGGMLISSWKMLLHVRGSVLEETITVIDGYQQDFTVTEVAAQLDAGTCTITPKINGTGLGGGSTSATTAGGTTAHASANTYDASADDKMTIDISSVSGATDLFVWAKVQEVL